MDGNHSGGPVEIVVSVGEAAARTHTRAPARGGAADAEDLPAPSVPDCPGPLRPSRAALQVRLLDAQAPEAPLADAQNLPVRARGGDVVAARR